MSRSCNICQLEPAVLKRIGDLVSQGLAERDIAQSVNDEFMTSIKQPALNRHLNNCRVLAEETRESVYENLELSRQKACLPTMTGRESLNALCRLFHENMESYTKKVKIKQQEGLDVSEDDLKELEVLVKTHERLYPGEAKNKGLFYDSSDEPSLLTTI